MLISYLIGYVIAYFLIRKGLGRFNKWEEFINLLILSLLSWVIVLLYVSDKIHIKLPKPPKWL